MDKLNTMMTKIPRQMMNLSQQRDERRIPIQIIVEKSFRKKIKGNWNSQ